MPARIFIVERRVEMKKPLIITGYPRGGTSVVARIFVTCGDY